ncbi:tetraspanin-18 isoform X2 [Condylostylus longicornis]|uniref:tetraspanin-18 isoform X2 n=1 Tax=Condylostylus longicornis TaxID=2530218 RepID=UPI00244E0190|nr:tetraspanin-18 isoform X2 [Condylostylus longicornis]
MAVDCGLWCAKYILCLFNFLFFILGTIVLGVGIWLAADKASLISLLKMVESEHIKQFTQPAVIEQLAYVLIICGAIMFILSFLGYCGAIRESRCLLTTYGIFMIIILIAEISVAGLAFGYKERAKSETKTFLQTTISKYYSSTEHTDAVTLVWNNIMAQRHCCGVNDYRDFEYSKGWQTYKENRTVPDACCVLKDMIKIIPEDPKCPTSPHSDNSYFQKGCYDAVVEWLLSNRIIIIAVALGVAIVQLLAIFLAFCLCKAISKYREIEF